MIASKVTFWKLAFRPSFAAIAFPRSTSRPMMVLPSVSKYSLGAYDASVAILSTPADLIAAGNSDAGSAAALPAGVDAAAVDGAADAAAVVAGGGAAELGLEPAVLFLLAQPVSARAAAIAMTPAAWVRGRRRSGVTDPPGSGRLSGSQYGPAFRRSQAGGRPAWCTSCLVHLSSRLSAYCGGSR